MKIDSIKQLRLKTLGSPDFKELQKKLGRHHRAVVDTFHLTHRHAKRLLKKYNVAVEHLRHGGTRAVAGAALASSLFVAPALTAPPKQAAPVKLTIPPPPSGTIKIEPQNPNPKKLNQDEFAQKLRNIMGDSLPREGTLSDGQLAQVQELVKQQLGKDVAKQTDSGFGLLHQYGYAGAEQHLPTHPGDTAQNHVNSNDPLAVVSGLTPGRGAWGYVPAGPEEQWYVVGQTFRSPQFGTPATKTLAGQRFLVIQVPNEQNGYHTSVIEGALWDAGPGVSTGKVFGLSPEYWYHLGDRAGSARRTQIIMLPITGAPDPASQLGVKL